MMLLLIIIILYTEYPGKQTTYLGGKKKMNWNEILVSMASS